MALELNLTETQFLQRLPHKQLAETAQLAFSTYLPNSNTHEPLKEGGC